MYLNASTDKIEIVLGGTVATNQLQWNVSYQDITSSGMTLPQSAGAGLTNNATAVDIVAAPAASTTRQVTQINVYNADTATATVTIQKDVSGTNYVLIQYALTTLDTLMWSREDGWRVMSATGGGGSGITALTGDVTATGPGSAAATIANDAVTYAKMQNVSAASRLLGRGSAGGAGDVEEITLGSGLSMTGTTLDTTGGGGGVTTVGTINSQTKSADGAVISGSSLVMQTADGTNPGLVSTGTQTFAGNKTFTGESATVGNALVVNNLTPTAKLTVANAGRVSLTSDTTVTTQTVSVITTATTNAGLVLAPNGTGAIMADTPDGTATGGNARGTNAVDLQISRTVNTEVASGNNSFIGGGDRNTASNTGSVVVGGLSNTASQTYSFVGSGFNNVASGVRSVVSGGGGSGIGNTASGPVSTISGGANNTASADLSSISGGYGARAYLYGQRANASVEFAAASDAQTSAITYRRSITGTGIQELFLDGSSTRAILNISSPGPTNARAWRAQVDVVAIVQTAGTGTLVLGECFMGSYHVGIKRIGATTSLVGTVSVTNEVSDTNMATSVVTIDADDTTEALRIRFTPPTGGTSSATSVIRVVATAYLTEVGY